MRNQDIRLPQGSTRDPAKSKTTVQNNDMYMLTLELKPYRATTSDSNALVFIKLPSYVDLPTGPSSAWGD